VPATTPKPLASSFSTTRLPVRPVEPATKTVILFFSAAVELPDGVSMVEAARQRKKSFLAPAVVGRTRAEGRWGREVAAQMTRAISLWRSRVGVACWDSLFVVERTAVQEIFLEFATQIHAPSISK
jgi:hypothetical protein